VPPEIVLRGTTLNPVVPTSLLPLDLDAAAKLVGRGPVRRAITASVDADAGSHSQSPQRPSPGSIIDMDAVHAVCKSVSAVRSRSLS
jgi:hypothetical protein